MLEAFDETGSIDLSLLLPIEIKMMERLKQEDEIAHSNNVHADCSLKTSNGSILRFQGFIEDDGSCIYLLTPYNDRDGEFVDTNGCLIEYF